MLPRNQRMSRTEFLHTFNTGRHVHTPFFHLLVAPHDTTFGVAAVVSKKVAKSAVARNRLRRRIYAALRELRDAREVPDQQYIVIAKPPARTMTYTALKEALRTMIGRTAQTRYNRANTQR